MAQDQMTVLFSLNRILLTKHLFFSPAFYFILFYYFNVKYGGLTEKFSIMVTLLFGWIISCIAFSEWQKSRMRIENIKVWVLSVEVHQEHKENEPQC